MGGRKPKIKCPYIENYDCFARDEYGFCNALWDADFQDGTCHFYKTPRQLKPKAPPYQEEKKLIDGFHAAGMTVTAISGRLGIPKKIIFEYLYNKKAPDCRDQKPHTEVNQNLCSLFRG